MTPLQLALGLFVLKSQGAPGRPWTKPVTPAMRAWAITIKNDATGFPMGATATKVFPEGNVLARVEVHTWTIREGKRITGRFRGVTLYEPPAVSG